MTLPPDLVEREFTRDDGPSLMALMADCDATYREWAPAGWSPPEVASDWADRFLEPGLWVRVVVDPADRVVAVVAFRREDGWAHVGILLVHPSRWREGVAGGLLARAESAMRARGFKRAQLWTPDGAPAERFYAALGWTRDRRREWNPWLGLEMVGYVKPLA